MAQVALEDLQKTFPGNVQAVAPLQLEVADGELLTIVGPSGCGKTTTLRMIAGLEEPTGGTIRIGSRVVNNLPPAERNIAMVFQDHALYPHLNVRDNLAFGLRMRKVPREAIETRVLAMAKRLSIEHLLPRSVDAISEGERQRVALGRALVREPDCFLLDEPLSSLDAALRRQLRGEIKQLHRQLSTTMIYVTHDQEDAMLLGDRMAVLSDGVLQQCAAPQEVYRSPANRFVASFIGSSEMNFVTGRLISENDQLTFDGGGLSIRLPDNMAEPLRSHTGDTVELGFRSHSIRLADGDCHGADFNAKVESVLPLGDVLQLQLQSEAAVRFVAQLDLHAPISPGSVARFSLASEDLHLFESSETGRRLL